jgi:DNA-binding response OmpR family regulator
VEDNPQLRDQLADTLIGSGYLVLTAANPFDAYYILEQGGVDLLLTDIQMSGRIDGAVLAKEVSTRWPHVLIVAISESASAEGNLPSGARFIKKPLNLFGLRTEVGAVLRQ